MPWRNPRFLLYVLAILAAGFVHIGRIAQENSNRTVEMVLDLASANDYARTRGQALKDVVREYHAAGVNSLVLTEQRWEELEAHGIAILLNGSQLSLTWPEIARRQHLDYAKSYVVVQQADQVDNLEQQLTLGVGKGRVRRWPTGDPDKIVLEVDLPVRAIQTLGLGFSEQQVKTWAAQNYQIWLRPENKPAADDATSLAVLQACHKLPQIQGVIFGGAANEAVGYPWALNTTIDYFREHKKLRLGFIELPKAAQQKGLESLVRAIPEQTVRVFAVPQQQQYQLTPDRLAQMYGLAARERNARVLYIRPYPYDPSPEKGFDEPNATFMSLLSADLKHVGTASLFDKPVVLPPLLAALMAAGAAGMAWTLLELFIPVPQRLGTLGVLFLAGVTGATCFITLGQFWRTLVAFGCAGTVSLYAVVHLYDEMEEVARRPKLWCVWLGSSALWVRMSLWSLSGALLASAFLQETTFKLGLDTFRGVKALTVGIPLLAVVAWFARRGDLKAFVSMFGLPIRLYHLIGFSLLAVVGILYTLRTGNTGAELAGDALEYEKILRMTLDQYLGVRPRFKEFLIAHPAMLLAPFALRYGGRNVAWVFVLAGATGQVGLADTFAHIHTPLLISLIRCLLGAAVGYVFTAAIFWPAAKFVQVLRGYLARGKVSDPASPIQSEDISN